VSKGGHFYSNALWSLLGAVLPLGVGLATMPILISKLGVERFGILNLAWLLVGYFSLFDFGLGRALTRLVAERLGSGRAEEIPELAGTATRLIRWLGFAAGFLLAGMSSWLVDWLSISVDLRDETLIGIWILAVALPFVLLSAGWRGILEAYGRFDLFNWVRIPLGVALFLAPLLVLYMWRGLVPVMVSLAVTRVVGWWLSRYMCFRLCPELKYELKFNVLMVRPLLAFGGWMTVSNIVGPLMVYADRFLIGGLLSATAVAYYATPYEIVTRLWIVSGALTSVLFPIVAARLVGDRELVKEVYRRAIKCIFVLILPPMAVLYLFAEEGLAWWLGSDFSQQGGAAARILLIGVFVNALGQVAITVLHGAGRADWAAKLHLLELPFYLMALVFAAGSYGIEGVALVWMLRVVIDMIVMALMAERLLVGCDSFVFRLFGGVMAMMILLWLVGSLGGEAYRFGLLCLLLLACGIFLPGQLRQLGRVANEPAKTFQG
jgi:O-antigen/teichoic acid export membrane protein